MNTNNHPPHPGGSAAAAAAAAASAPANNNSNNSNTNTNTEHHSKREEFRRYLEKTGVLDALTKALVGLYEEPDRFFVVGSSTGAAGSNPHNSTNNSSTPIHALDYVKKYLGAPTGVDWDGLKRENEDLRQQVEHYKKLLLLQETTTPTTTSDGTEPAAPAPVARP